MINNIYRDYKIFKKIIINKKINLWIFAMNQTFELLETKYRKIIFYYSRINETMKRFNDVLSYILIKYCIEQFIKNWNFYLNQVLFATRIRTYTTIDFFFFYLLYEINFTLFDDIEKFSFELYDKRIDSTSFLNKNHAKIFKKTI